MTELQQQAERETHRLLRQAMGAYGKRPPKVEIRFDLSGRTAGQIRLPTKGTPVIRYNRLLLEENGEAFIDQTVPHEVAHLVARRVYGPSIKPHGREWRELMAFFGAEARRCHGYDISRTPTRRVRRFSYACGCRKHQLSSIRHNRVLAGQQYLCTHCGKRLERE